MHFAAVAPFSFPMFNLIIEPGSCNVGVVQCVTILAAHASAWDRRSPGNQVHYDARCLHSSRFTPSNYDKAAKVFHK